MSFQPPDQAPYNPQYDSQPDRHRAQPHPYNDYSEKQPISKPSGYGPTDPNQNYNVGILPHFGERETNNKQEYGRVLKSQAREREMNAKMKKQQDLELDKKLLEERMTNDPFGSDRQKYLRAYHRSLANSRNAFVGIGSQIVSKAPSYSPTKEEINERNTHNAMVDPEILQKIEEQRRVEQQQLQQQMQQQLQKQQDELKRAYEQQVAERERRLLDDMKHKLQDEKDEMERIKRYNDLQLQRQNQENSKMLAQQNMMQSVAQQSYMSFMMQSQAQAQQASYAQQQQLAEIKALQEQVIALQNRPPPEPPIDPWEIAEEMRRMEDERRKREDERLKDIKAGLFSNMNRQVSDVVKHEMDRLKTQMGAQSRMLKDQLLTLKNQVLLAEELKQDAHQELKNIQKDIKGFDIYEDIRTRNLGKYLKDVAHLYNNTQEISDNGNFNFEFPSRRYKPAYKSHVDTTGELAAEIHHLAVPQDRGLPSVNDYSAKTRGLSLPEYVDMNTKNPYYQEARAENQLKGREFGKLDSVDGDAYERNQQRLDILNGLDDDSRKLDSLLRDSLLRGTDGWGTY